MTKKITISLDAMGGANAPSAVLLAASMAYKKHTSINYMIYGEERTVLPILKSIDLPQSAYSFIPTQTIILDHDKPMHALKYGKNSSMRKAIDAVKDKQANACVSCGNTGALMVTAKMVLGSLHGIKRPAIAGLFPNFSGNSVMLDMGANNECNELILFQFALMGSCFAKAVLKIDNPTIAILNVGEEEIKGRELEQKTYELLKSSGLNFIGYIEGHDIVKGKANVIVTDGFSGNLVLKSSEGAVNMFLHLLKEACYNNGILPKIGALLLKNALKKSLRRIDPNINNGALFVGVNGIVVKSHGSAEAQGIANAIGVAYALASCSINEQITNELKILEEQGIGLNFVEKIKHTSAKILGINK